MVRQDADDTELGFALPSLPSVFGPCLSCLSLLPLWWTEDASVGIIILMTTAQKILHDFRELPVEEKVALAEQLWGELEGELDSAPPSQAERVFLRERLAAVGADSRPDVEWSVLRSNLFRKP